MISFKKILSEATGQGKVFYFDLDDMKVVQEKNLTGTTSVDDLLEIFGVEKVDKSSQSKYGKDLGKKDVYIYWDHTMLYFAKDKKELESVYDGM